MIKWQTYSFTHRLALCCNVGCYIVRSVLCVWPAWRSVGSSSGHTVGGMCMQPAGVATGKFAVPIAMQVYAKAREEPGW
jgi:hypothetical protein